MKQIGPASPEISSAKDGKKADKLLFCSWGVLLGPRARGRKASQSFSVTGLGVSRGMCQVFYRRREPGGEGYYNRGRSMKQQKADLEGGRGIEYPFVPEICYFAGPGKIIIINY